jgi:hypothetical protein
MAERSWRRRKERAKARANFISNPFQFTARLLGKKTSGKLQCPMNEVEDYLKQVHSDPRMEEDLPYLEILIQPEPPDVQFNEKEPSLEEINDVVKKGRMSSAPGPNGIPYKVYKNCPMLTTRLWKIFKVIWRKGELVKAWHKAEGCFIAKEENSDMLQKFRTIWLLNVEGKKFLSVMAKRLTNYLLDNNYIDISVLKVGVPGISGCLEHTCMISEIIREAREKKGDLAVIWLDLANAYGSIPHKLVELMLERYYVPEKIKMMLKGYFENISIRFTVNGKETKWQRLEVGIVHL